MQRVGLIGLLLVVTIAVYAEKQSRIQIVTYNVENLFYPLCDTVGDDKNPDREFTPEGKYRWSFTRYRQKLHNIAKVLTCINGDSLPAIVGLCEVEDKRCAEDLVRMMPHSRYKFIHYDSPDARGIDVVLLYDSVLFRPIVHKQAAVVIQTRDILYTKGVLCECDTLHLLLCHYPSQRGGARKSGWKREKAHNIVTAYTDSIFRTDVRAKIVVMGDFNSAPRWNLPHLVNLASQERFKGTGTYKYQGIWTCLDQFYVSECIQEAVEAEIYRPSWLMEEDRRYMDVKPMRTYLGYRYRKGGFSDHLPFVLTYSYPACAE